jgi:hypothetical protein
MAISDATYPWARRASFGTLHYKNIYNSTFGYTETQKKVAAGVNNTVVGVVSGAAAAATYTTGITQPDVPRCLSFTPQTNPIGSPFTFTITGVNVEGKPITEDFNVPAASTAIINGSKAFKRVTSYTVAGNTTGLSGFVGTQNKLGINHRLFNQNTTVKVYSASAAYGTLTLQGAPTVVANETDVEKNTVTPATTPNGSTFYIIAYTFDNWADGTSVNDAPEYSTTTSTSSTSSSTSTTTITTSTSSTSSSTSSTSTSSTSSSISTSSTSTSTTTAP